MWGVVETLRKIARSEFRWVSVVPSDWAHNPKVAGSNPAPATKFQAFWDRVVTDL